VAGETAHPTRTAIEAENGAAPAAPPHGLLPCQEIRALIRAGEIVAAEPIDEAQIQPASLDLRLGGEAWRVRTSFLAGPGATVEDRLAAFGMHRFDLDGGAVLEKGCVYVVPLLESLALGRETSGIANPKSSTGRLDVFTRLITDNSGVFDQIAAGYAGPMWAEISPRTFSILVRRGTSVSQLRLRRGAARPAETASRRPHATIPPLDMDAVEQGIGAGTAITVDLAPPAGLPAGWRARHHTGLIDLAEIARYDPAEFWEPVFPDAFGCVVLNPGDFYILASKEAVTVPPDHAAEMRPYDERVGEFRVHYAGFFDPGFGLASAGGEGSRAVLEIRSFEVPFALRDGQFVGRLVYERLTAVPERLYGSGIGSSYQRQGLQLAKQFRRPGGIG